MKRVSKRKNVYVQPLCIALLISTGYTGLLFRTTMHFLFSTKAKKYLLKNWLSLFSFSIELRLVDYYYYYAKSILRRRVIVSVWEVIVRQRVRDVAVEPVKLNYYYY